MVSINSTSTIVSKFVPIHGHQNCDTSQILIFGGYVKAKESLNTGDILWVDTILNHIDTRAVSRR